MGYAMGVGCAVATVVPDSFIQEGIQMIKETALAMVAVLEEKQDEPAAVCLMFKEIWRRFNTSPYTVSLLMNAPAETVAAHAVITALFDSDGEVPAMRQRIEATLAPVPAKADVVAGLTGYFRTTIEAQLAEETEQLKRTRSATFVNLDALGYCSDPQCGACNMRRALARGRN